MTYINKDRADVHIFNTHFKCKGYCFSKINSLMSFFKVTLSSITKEDDFFIHYAYTFLKDEMKSVITLALYTLYSVQGVKKYT